MVRFAQIFVQRTLQRAVDKSRGTYGGRQPRCHDLTLGQQSAPKTVGHNRW